jgi:hypothetical protein
MDKYKDTNILFFASDVTLAECCGSSRSRFEDVDYELYIPEGLVS